MTDNQEEPKCLYEWQGRELRKECSKKHPYLKLTKSPYGEDYGNEGDLPCDECGKQISEEEFLHC